MVIKGRAVILTALSLEAEAVAAQTGGWQEVTHPRGTIYRRATFGPWDILLAEIGAGNTASAQETERIINYFNPQLALFVGVAGGIKDVDLGDVVAATKIYGYESGVDETEFKPRPEVGQSSYPLVQRCLAIARQDEWRKRLLFSSESVPRIFVGPIAAGGKVVKSSEGYVARLIRQTYSDAVALEMEGSGFIRAVYASSIDGMVIRGISDLLDGKAEADRTGSQQRASAHAAALAFELLATLGTSPASVTADLSPQGISTTHWERLRNIAPRLYPTGPKENELWIDAGGDISRLDLSGDGRSQWSRAIRRMEQGAGVSFHNLVKRMLEDFPSNYDLTDLAAAATT